MGAEQMYQEEILDHYRNPRNYGTLEQPDIRVFDTNPLCGDEIGMHLAIAGETIADIRFSGKGCAISQASASMLTEMVKGKKCIQVKELSKEDVLGALGIPISAARLKCALLGYKVLKTGVYQHLGAQATDEFW